MIRKIILTQIVLGILISTNAQVDLSVSQPLSAAVFQTPDNNQYKPFTWWHWINGNITKEGIRKDLTDMKRVGIAGVQLFDTHMYLPPGPVRYGTQAWFDHVAFAIRICDSLGMDFYVTNSPGWSGSGGPWITPEKSMKKLVFSERDIKGKSMVDIEVPQPFTYGGFYRDVKLLAVPAKGNEENIRKQLISVSNGKANLVNKAIIDGDYTTGIEYTLQKESPLLFEFASSVEVNMLTIDLQSPGVLRLGGMVEGSADGAHYEQMAKFTFDNHKSNSGNFPIPLAESRVKYIRVVLSDSKVEGNATVKLNEFTFRNLYQLKDWSRRTGIVKAAFLPQKPFDIDGSKALSPKDIIDLSEFYDVKTNRLHWNAPSGSWTLLRFGYTSTGATVHPAVEEGSGLEADKLDTAVVKFQFEQSVGKIIRAAGAYTGKTFKGILFDSFEGGFQNWTGNMPALFSQVKGYDCDAVLPALAGRTVSSLRHTATLLWDFQDALTKLFAINYYAVMQRKAHEHKLLLFAEGQGGPMSPAVVDAYADVPMNEFWTGGRVFARENQILQTVSIANVLGKRLIGAESFTSRPEYGKWQNTPYTLKRTGDYAFALGINKFIFHTYTHQPYDIAPGFTMGRYGTHFGRTNTWWRYAGDWLSYLGRSQYLLQQGKIVADICYLFPQDAVYEFAPRTKKPPFGYRFDILYPDRLSALRCNKGIMELPGGAQYKLMVLPDYPYMTYETLEQVDRLLKDGAVLSGPPPAMAPDMAGTRNTDRYNALVKTIWGGLDGKSKRVASRGKGKIYWGESVEKIMQAIKLQPDISFSGISTKDTVLYIHRATRDADIYFISAQSEKALSFTAKFRIKGKQPELWDPVTGKTWPALVYDTGKGLTSVPLSLAPSGSLFVVFRKLLPSSWVRSVVAQGKTSSEKQGYVLNYPGDLITHQNADFLVSFSDGSKKTVVSRPVMHTITVKGDWNVSFTGGMGAPANTIFPKLISWDTHSDASIRYYSGAAVYTNAFTLTGKPAANERAVLSLGKLYDIAEVFVNGQRVGIVWTKPYQADITPFLRRGKNELRIVVVNRWINRLIGDAFIANDLKYDDAGSKFTTGRLLEWPAWLGNPSVKRTDKRHTFTTWKHYGTTDALVPSGLLGPVQIVFYRTIPLTH